MANSPDFSLETKLLAQGKKYIAGVDEVGRGPWAGSVVAGAVIIDINNIPKGCNDSKKLSPKKREVLHQVILNSAKVAIGEATVEEIDSLNILGATFLAMKRAISNLPIKPDYALIDGNAIPPRLDIPAKAIIRGDSKSISIACASIIAKVTRDKMMVALSKQYPHFAWEKNAGYGTAAHQAGLRSFGVTPHHRRSFAPIRKIIESRA